MGKMAKGEREELRSLMRKSVAAAKSRVEDVVANRTAEFERQLATVFEAEHAAFRDLSTTAESGIAKLDSVLAQRCDALGIPRAFRPRLEVGWSGRGVNASKEKRAELRRVHQTQMEAQKRRAFAAFERWELAGRIELTRDALATEAGHAFLATIPTPEALVPPMPEVDVLKLTRMAPREAARALEAAMRPEEESAADVQPPDLAALLNPPAEEPEEGAEEDPGKAAAE
jgi:hypothetical protein